MHLTMGYLYWTRRMVTWRQKPAFSPCLAALPLLVDHLQAQQLESPGATWIYGNGIDFLLRGKRPVSDAIQARTMISLPGSSRGSLTFSWSRELSEREASSYLLLFFFALTCGTGALLRFLGPSGRGLASAFSSRYHGCPQ